MKGLPPDLIRLMVAEAEEEERKDTITTTDAAEQLRNGYEVFTKTYPAFTEGQLLRPKKGVEDGYKDPRGGVVMFVRMLTEDERELVRQSATRHDLPPDGALMVGARDCLCLRLMPNGAVMAYPATTYQLEPFAE